MWNNLTIENDVIEARNLLNNIYDLGFVLRVQINLLLII